MHVTEETHCGIVPMNHSNKDGTSSAESEEGRLRIKESASQSNTCPTQSGEACVSQGLTGVRTSGSLGRYSSEIRTGCAKERPSGSVRGAPGDWCPYRDHQPSGGAVELLMVRLLCMCFLNDLVYQGRGEHRPYLLRRFAYIVAG